MFSVRMGAIENIDTLIRKKGYCPDTILRRVGWNVGVLKDPDSLVSHSKLADLLDYCAESCRAPMFGFELGQLQGPIVMGEIATLLAQQPTIQRMMEFSKRYHHIHAQGYAFSERCRDGRVQIQYDFAFSNETELSQLIQLSVSQHAQYLRAVLPANYRDMRIHIRQVIPQNCQPLLGWLWGLLESQSDFDGFSFPNSWLSMEVPRNQPLLDIMSENRVTKLDRCYPVDLHAKVMKACIDMLGRESCTIEKVASSLGLKPRSLQCQLEKDELSFRSILKNARQQKAEQYLLHRDLSITDIALSLGYSEVAVFTRMFKSWTGLTPSRWRKRYQ